MDIHHRAVLFFSSVLLIAASVFFSASSSQAGSKWLEQCHGLPGFSKWNVEPIAKGSADMVYHFATHCAEESKLFGYNEQTFFIKGTWNRDNKAASELITNINRYITPNGHKETKTVTIKIDYACQANDPWANHYGNQCHPVKCTSTASGLCGIEAKYSKAKELTQALLGPLEISAPTNGEFIAPDFSGYKKVVVKLHGPAKFVPKTIALSMELKYGNNDWESPFPSPGETYHIPSSANRVATPHAGGIAAIYEVPMTYDTFKLSPSKTLNGKWRIQACAQGIVSQDKICSPWTEFKVVNMLYYRVHAAKLHRMPAKIFKLKHVSK